ncbi:dethiobiotin synthase [bacterium]|nr:dethiobiotin synthase [bacterium]
MVTCFITGIDTGVGKTYATGAWANHLINHGQTVITAKLVQTGCRGISEDIQLHRKLMQVPLHDLDRDGTTCPYVFSLPASPHLAAAQENRSIDCSVIDTHLERLGQVYETILLEGAGGIQVPITPDCTMLDFVAARNLPVLVVTSPRLGSINHTLLTLEALLSRNITVIGMVYNLANTTAPKITDDSRKLFQTRYPRIPLIDMPQVEKTDAIPAIDFAKLNFPGKTQNQS